MHMKISTSIHFSLLYMALIVWNRKHQYMYIWTRSLGTMPHLILPALYQCYISSCICPEIIYLISRAVGRLKILIAIDLAIENFNLSLS